MNRIHQSVKSPQQLPGSTTFRIESALFSAVGYDTIHTLFMPLHYERGYAYPLIVWLHGPDDDERQLRRVMPLVSMRNYVAVAPRGGRIAGPDQQGCGWRQTEKAIGQATERIFESIQIAGRKLHVNRRRIFLVGFDSGGTMALRVAMNHPNRFAGVLSLCGAFPGDCTPFWHLREARHLPILLAAGRYSRDYTSAEVCENLRLFHSAGLSFTLRQYPCGQELIPQMLADVNRWIIEQITPTDTLAAKSNRQWS